MASVGVMHMLRSWLAPLTALLAIGLASAVHAQAPGEPIATARLILDPTQPEYSGDAVDPYETPDGAYIWAGVEFTIPEGWHIYWRNPGDSGIPTSLTWQIVPEGVTPGSILWPVPKRAEMGGLVNYGYEKKIILPVPIQVGYGPPDVVFDDDNTQRWAKGLPVNGELTVKADWLVCKDICIPESQILSARIEEPSSAADIAALRTALSTIPNDATSPDAYVTADDKTVRIAVHTQANSHADIFPIDDGWFSNNATPTVTRAKEWIGFTLPRASAPLTDTLHAVISITHEGVSEYFEIRAMHIDLMPINDDFPATLFDDTAVSTSNADAAPASMGLGGALLFALIGGLILNLMPCVLPVLSLKMLSLSRKADASRSVALKHGLAYTGGVLLSFALIGGALLALKAGGAAIGWGFQLQSPGFVLALLIIVFLVALNLLSVFELPVLFGNRGQDITARDSALGSFATGVLAVALATPCTAPFMAPALGAALTLPAFASMLIFLSLGLGLALPYLLVSISPAARRLLPKPGAWMQRFKELLAFPMFATAAWLLWVLSEQTAGMGLLQAFALLIIIALALWGLKHNHASLWRAFWKVLLVGSIICALVNPPNMAATTQTSTEHVAYDAGELARLRSEGTPVFIDATAAWCLTCKVNERVALQNSRIVSLFKEKNITFMVADWTRRDEAITQWLASFGRNGVPLYVYYPPGKDPVVLPQLLTPDLVADAIGGSE